MLGTVLQVLQEEDASARSYLVVKTAPAEARANKNQSTVHQQAMVEHKPLYINLPHTLSAYSSWSVYIFVYQISETDRYLPLPSIPGAGNTVAVADPAVITNFQL